VIATPTRARDAGREAGVNSDVSSYPRPQFRREEWQSLDGDWEFAIDPEGLTRRPEEVQWNATIRVPFAPETPASGIHDTGFYRSVWYRRSIEIPSPASDQRVLLLLGAVDYHGTIWINGQFAARHEGGYTPITVDITDLLNASGPQTIVVRAEDDPHDLTQPRGKQDWQLEPHAIWYPRTTGIWQSVWLEVVPSSRIEDLYWSSNLERWEIELDARIERAAPGHQLGLVLRARDEVLASDRYTVVGGRVHRRIALPDPGIDNARNELLWRPESPTLIDAELTLYDANGTVLDHVKSYTALRTVGVEGNHFILNGRPFQLRLVLDQGYWSESGLTAPGEDALRKDIELVLAMGFNGVRKHQKIEDPRFLGLADQLGLLVWEEMPSVYSFSPDSMRRLTEQWMRAIERDRSHPCIVAWVPINESWGVPDLPRDSAQRNAVSALYHLTKTLDPTRPVIGNDGWEIVATDIVAIHDYDSNLRTLAARYSAPDVVAGILDRARPHGRMLTTEEFRYAGEPMMLTEFGGIACTPPGEVEGTWGYVRSEDQAAFARDYAALLETVHAMPVFCGFCYTQLTDTYQEANGLLNADRTPKIPLAEIARATRGAGRRSG
jgi:beta-galactosidase/beta-glucuronidase